MAVLTVGLNQRYTTIATAVAAAHDGDVVDVTAGTYTNDIATINARISLVATGGPVLMLDTLPLANRGATITVNADATISGFILAGAHAADGSAAAIRDTAGTLTLSDDLVTNNDTGLVATASTTGSVLVQTSEFAANGTGGAGSANIAVGAIGSLTVQTSYIHDAQGGAEISSLAQATTITFDRIEDNNAASTVSIDLPNAGVVDIHNDTIEKGPASTVPAEIRIGGGTTAPHSVVNVVGNIIVNDAPAPVVPSPAIAVQNTSSVVANVTANSLYGFNMGPATSGPVKLLVNTDPSLRPTVSAAPLIAQTVSSTSAPVEYGRTGAVTADGTVLTVGSGYATFAAALAAAQDGDTIDLPAGTYAIDPTTVGHKVIIQGVGGMAHFIAASAPGNGQALFVTAADATFRNVEISGVAAPGGLAAAIQDAGGNLTLVNADVHDNQAGVTALASAKAVIGIYDSEIARNGTPDGRGANVDVAEVQALALRNDWLHDAVAGPELRSRADATTLSGDRISQMAGNGGSDIVLPNGGTVSITGSAIEKGVNSLAAPLVDVGGAATYAGSSVGITGTTLVSDFKGAATRFVVSETGAVPVSLNGTVFVGGTAGSVQAGDGVVNTGATTQTGVAVSTGAPWGATGAPVAGSVTTASSATGAAAGVLQVRVSEDAYQGDARFNLLVDGTQVGGTLTATASHAAGQSQTFSVAGSFGAGPHTVQVQYLNDVRGMAAGEARDLYVDDVAFDGVDTGEHAALTANGTATITTGTVTTPTALTFDLSELTAQGDAQAFVTVDGQVQGGLQTVTAAHGSGTEALSVLVGLSPGAHTASVAFLNPGATRALFVDSVLVAGQSIPSASASLHSAAPASFAFNVTPPAAANGVLTVSAATPVPFLAPHS